MEKSTKKFAEADRQYLSRREALAKKYSKPELWSAIDHWPLYAGLYSISRFHAIGKYVEQSIDIPGHLAEIGSWRGANLLFMAKLLRILEPHSNKQVHSFDDFEGLQRFSDQDGDAVRTKGYYRGSIDELMDVIEMYDLTEDIIIHRGRAEQTIPALLAERSELSFSMVYIDVDLYEPTISALSHLHDRLALGGMFIFDEWNTAMFPGETVAVREFLRAHPGSYRMEHVRHTRQPTLVLRRVDP